MDLEGRLFAKTGTISNVKSLSKYLVRVDGTEVVFSSSFERIRTPGVTCTRGHRRRCENSDEIDSR
jgi:D-alanyl-D-alanine carboxypeptidase